MNRRLLTGIGQLVTNRSNEPGDLGIVTDAAVAIENGRVTWAGPRSTIPQEIVGFPELDCEGRAVVPGFVDAHTHLVFAGDRAEEFARRLRGDRYEEILAAGGGILTTVEATRAASESELLVAATTRAERMLRAGTTTVEVKSGYGLDVTSEVKMLRVAVALGETLPLDVVPTFLGAHVVPPAYRDRRSEYIDLVCGPMLDACAPLARFCDVFCDAAAFSVDEARRILVAGGAAGLRARLHADQLSRVGAAALAADLGAVSADHLDHASGDDLAALQEAGSVAVLLPAVSLSLRLPYPDGRRIWDSGVTVALATDCNPGTAWVETMPLVISLACLEMGLTPAEALWAATRGGALAVGAEDKGWIVPGAVADVVVLDAPSFLHVPYRPDSVLPWRVVKSGRVLAP